MNKIGLAVKLLEHKDRRCNDRRVFSYTAVLPERRVRPDRRSTIPLRVVALEDEEIASLLEPSGVF